MINNLTELKEFLTWAKQNKVKSVKLKDVEFEISDLAFLQEEAETSNIPKALSDVANAAEDELDEEALFWSSR